MVREEPLVRARAVVVPRGDVLLWLRISAGMRATTVAVALFISGPTDGAGAGLISASPTRIGGPGAGPSEVIKDGVVRVTPGEPAMKRACA